MTVDEAVQAEDSEFLRPRLQVTAGPLAGAIVERFISALGGEAALPVDRLQEAAMIGQAIAHACMVSGSAAEISVQLGQAELMMRVGPLAGGAAALLRADTDGVVHHLATSTEVRYGHSGEYLLVTVREN